MSDDPFELPVRTTAPTTDEWYKWYQAPFTCFNCGARNTNTFVRKGTQRKGLKVPCENCECQNSL